ncbi:MAG: FG-GAP repeat protein [Acidobacteria bacterium]|nr:FG-GAP repeat protein [Acidobacteriota bacterium]
MKARTLTVSLCLLTLCACAAAPSTKEEQRAAAPQTNAAQPPPAAAPSPAAAATPAPPAAQEARAAVERVYKGAVVFDGGGADAAAVGDFNGDGSEDIVVRARPAPGRLAEVNDEVANWIVSDPRAVTPPDPREFNPHQGVQKLAPHARPQVEASDALLVVLHGYKEAGWRDPEARQSFLLKGVAGEGLRPEPRAEAQAAAQDRRLRLLGDVLREKLGGAQGFLYWTGAGYGWLGTENSRR